jgi:hypothetical protein
MFVVSAVMLGLVLAANGLAMLYDPAGWYGVVPGVPDTGPLNAHFVRDIGCTYVVAGGAQAVRSSGLPVTRKRGRRRWQPLGHGHACRRVTVGGAAVSVLKHAA